MSGGGGSVGEDANVEAGHLWENKMTAHCVGVV